MYGTGQNKPFGLKPVSYQNGSIFSGQEQEYLIASGYATSLFTGDPVAVLADGTIGIGVAGSAIIGVFNGVKYTDANGVAQFSAYWPASTVTMGAQPATALIFDDPEILYDIQVASAAGGTVAAPTLAQTDMFSNANFAVTVTAYNPIGGVTPAPNPGAGNTRSGLSGYYLSSGSINTTATLSLKLMRFTPVPGNIGGVVFNNALVLINNHTVKGGTGTLGV